MKSFEEYVLKTKKLEEDFFILKTKLDDSYTTYENIVNYIPLGLIFVTTEGKIILFNKEAEKITGYQSSEVHDKPFWEFFSDMLFGFSLKKALLEKEKKRTVFLTLTNEKKEHHLEVSFSEVPTKGIIITFRDATEIRTMKQALDRNERLKDLGEMAARLAHEIRNPLGGIEGFAHLLLRELKDQPEKSHMASSIIDGTRLLNRLVTSVLHYARPLEVHFARWDLINLIKDVISLVLAEEKEGKTCTFLTKEDVFFSTVDKELFEMAFLNILKNALQATKPMGKVLVTFSKERQKVLISIKDEGPGIAKEHLEKIFTPFFTTKSKGTGLGLSEAHKIMEAHGGKIDIETSEQSGTSVTLKLPLNDAP